MGAKPRCAGRFVAFLRGMNLGRRRITNDELGRAFAALGLADVDVFLASGNVVFASPRSADALESFLADGLQEALGYPVPTYVRSAQQVRDIAAHAPFGEGALSRSTGKVQVMLLERQPTAAARERVLALSSGDDRLAVRDRELYWLPAGNLSASELDLKAIERALGPGTVRTQNTMTRLVARFLSQAVER